jgi:hypothetical protein
VQEAILFPGSTYWFERADDHNDSPALNQSRAQLVILDPFGDFIEASSPALLSKSKIMTIEELVLATRDSRLLSEHASWAMCLLKNMNRSCVTFLIFNAKILVASIRAAANLGSTGNCWEIMRPYYQSCL